MSRVEEIGHQVMWILGHILFTLITVCAVRGGYQFYLDYEWSQKQNFDLSELSVEQKNEILQTLLEDPLIEIYRKK